MKPIEPTIRKAAHFTQLLPVPSHRWMKLDLLKILVQRELEARYKRPILGDAWTIMNQWVQLLVYTYLFSIVLKVKLELKGLPANDFTFGLWLYAGLISWVVFISGISIAVFAIALWTYRCLQPTFADVL